MKCNLSYFGNTAKFNYIAHFLFILTVILTGTTAFTSHCNNSLDDNRIDQLINSFALEIDDRTEFLDITWTFRADLLNANGHLQKDEIEICDEDYLVFVTKYSLLYVPQKAYRTFLAFMINARRQKFALKSFSGWQYYEVQDGERSGIALYDPCSNAAIVIFDRNGI